MNDFPQRTKSDNQWRYSILYILIVAIFGYFLLRLFDIQILQGAAFQAQADDNRTRIIRDPSIRGTIYDRNGYILAQNVPSYNVVVIPGYLPPDEGDTQAIFREVSELINMPVSLGDTDEETVRAFTPCVSELGIKSCVYCFPQIGRFKPQRWNAMSPRTLPWSSWKIEKNGRGLILRSQR